MTNRPTKKPTGPTAEELSGELYALSVSMSWMAHRVRRYGRGRGTLQQAECALHAEQLFGASYMVYQWSLEVKKDGGK
jgi:hypothetical protein